jgi:hypothetical protein
MSVLWEKGRRIDGAVLQVVEGAVIDVGDQVGAQLRVGDIGPARSLDQPVAEQHPVLLVGQLAGKLCIRRRDHLERGLEEPRHDVAHLARVVAEKCHTDGDIADHHRRLAAQLVHDYHIGPWQEETVVEQHKADQPAPAVKPSRCEQSREGRDQNAGHRDGLDQPEVVVATHDGGDGVEHPGQGIDVAVGVDFKHGGLSRAERPALLWSARNRVRPNWR